MKYKIKLNDEDYLCFNVFYAHHSKAGKRQENKMRLLFPLSAVIAIMIFFLAGAKSGLIVTEAIGLCIVSVIWCIFTPQIMEKNIRKHIDKLKTDGKLPYHVDAEIEFQEQIIVERSEQGEIHVNYKDIENIYVEKDYLYILYSVTQGFIVPYRCLGEDREQVVEYVRERFATRQQKTAE